MGVPTSEVGYTPAMPRSTQGHVVALDLKKKLISRPSRENVLLLTLNMKLVGSQGPSGYPGENKIAYR